jgi:hypothetical protein
MRGFVALIALAAGFACTIPSRADVIVLGGSDPTVFAGINTGSLQLAAFADTQPGEVLADFTATIGWGDGTSSGGTIAGAGSGTFDVGGSHTYTPDGVAVGDFYQEGNLDVSVADQNGGSASVLFNQGIVATEGMTFTGIVGSFTDSNPSSTANMFTATIDWGDGTMSSATILANGSGGFDIQGTHNYDLAGSYEAAISLDDGAGTTLDITSQILVQEVPEPGTLGTLTAILAVALGVRGFYQAPRRKSSPIPGAGPLTGPRRAAAPG